MFGTFALQTPTQHNRWVYTAMRDTYLTWLPLSLMQGLTACLVVPTQWKSETTSRPSARWLLFTPSEHEKRHPMPPQATRRTYTITLIVCSNKNEKNKNTSFMFNTTAPPLLWLCAIAYNRVPAFILSPAGEVVTTAAAGSILSTHWMDFWDFLFCCYHSCSKTLDKIKRECFGLSEFVLHEPGLPSAVAASLVYSGSSKQDFLSFGFPPATPMYNTMTELCNENGTRVSPVPGDRLYRVVGDLFWKLNPSWRSAPAFA